MIKKTICVIFIMFLLGFNVNAEATDIYKEQLEKSGALNLTDSLDENTKEYLINNGIDLSNYDWVNNLKTENVFSHILSFLRGGFKKPLFALTGIIAIIIINALLFNAGESSVVQAVSYAATLAITGIIITPIFSAITSAVNAMKGVATFMTAFIPVFSVITAATGKAATSVSMSTLLLGAANGVSLLSNYAVVPLISGHLCLSLSSSVSPFINSGGISSSIKKLSLWVMSLISAVFLGVLSLQTVFNSHADNLTMRTAKFIIGSSVPVAGGVLSEALGTLTASVSLLKSSVGIYGVVICCIIFLPVLIELLLWRAALFIADFVSLSFEMSKISSLLQAIDTVLSVLIGVLLLTGAMFIISLSIVIGGGSA